MADLGYIVFGPDDPSYVVIKANLLSTTSGKGASMVGIQDSGNYYLGSTVESALQGIGSGTATMPYLKKSGGTMTGTIVLRAGTASAGTGPIKFQSGSLLATPETGDVNFSNNKFYITCKNTQRVVDRSSDVALETVTLTDTTDETVVYTASVPANSLVVGNILKLNISGVIDEAAASDFVTIRIKMGAYTMATIESPASGTVSKCWRAKGDCTVREIGATGSLAWYINMNAAGTMSEDCGIATPDTTTNNDVTVTAQWNTAKAGNIFTLTQGFMEYKN